MGLDRSLDIEMMWGLVALGCWLVLPIVPLHHTITADEPVQDWRVEDEAEDKGRVCGNIDIRNSVQELEKLRGCRIVEGFLQIVLIDKATSLHYSNYTFPDLREIAGYLLLYRVTGLKTLGQLFPNLCVIRGKVLFVNYSLVVYEMFQLEDLGLRSLTAIVRGAVRIEKNPELCYLHTVNWATITLSGGEHFIKENKEASQCPPCSECVTGLCWSEQRCQQTDQGECHEQCLGGCWGRTAHHCNACRAVRLHGECLAECPTGRYPYLVHHCVTEKQCQVMENQKALGSRNRHQQWPFERQCVHICPSPQSVKLIRSPNGQVLGCEQCHMQCPCSGSYIDGIQSAQTLKGCTLIDGSLIIEVQGGENIIQELEENLGMIEEIFGTLTIARSFPLKSLSFLKNLRVIHGITTDDQMPLNRSLLVYDNQNLKELWDWSTKSKDFKIKNGRLFFHDNPKLCISEIEKLNKIAGLGNFTNYEVSHKSNGDKVSCNHSNDINLVVNVTKLYPKSVLLEWRPLKVEDQALRYIVYYIKAPVQNITSYDDTCGGNDHYWRINYVEVPSDPTSNVYHIITRLEPNKQYAYYITLVTMSTYVVGQSSTQYFQTLPDRPSVPNIIKAISNVHSELEIQWTPPKNVNGVLKYYFISGTWLRDEEEYFDRRNYCVHPITSDTNHLKEDANQKMKCVDKAPSCCNTDLETDNEHSYKTYCENKDDVAQSTVGYSGSKTETWEDNVIDFLLTTTSYETDTKHGDQHKSQSNKVDQSSDLWGPGDYLDSTTNNKNQHFEFVHKVRANTTKLIVKNLKNFALYSIQVKACRESSHFDETRCSFASLATVRSMPQDDADAIDSDQVRIYTWNNTVGHVRMDWQKPKKPNGVIISYHIHAEYRRVDNEKIKPLEECLTRRQHEEGGMGYLIKNLSPGKYSFRIRATSLAGEGSFTKKIEFEVLEPLSTIVLGEAIAIVFGSLLAPAAVVLLLIYCKRRRDKNLALIASVNPDYMNASLYMEDEWELDRDNIQFDKELGKGSFGIVYEGMLKPDNIPCAIKTVNENSTPREHTEFLNEASLMKSFSEAHYVVRLLGVVSRVQPPLVIMELMAMGDLKSFLRERREGSEQPDFNQLLVMAAQIADGMAYLETRKFVHRDLAARNCMVGGDLTVKVGDFGMTRDIYETDYYRNGSQGLLPVRWMAPESLADGVFTSQSDVWSYGVVLWEMATLAEQPYQGLANEQVMLLVLGGGVLERPTECPDFLHSLMSLCWSWRPETRPSFLHLIGRIDKAVDLGLQFQLASFYYNQENRIDTQQVVSTDNLTAEPDTQQVVSPVDIYADPDTQQVVARWRALSPVREEPAASSLQVQRIPPPPKKVNKRRGGDLL